MKYVHTCLGASPLAARATLDRRRRWLAAGGLACASLLLVLAWAPEGAQAQSKAQADVVFAIDESGSLANDQAQVLARSKEIAKTLGKQVDPRFALVGFGSSDTHAQSLTPGAGDGGPHTHSNFTGVSGFSSALGGLVTDGVTELGVSATSYAMSSVQGFRPNAGTCVVLITDEDSSFATTESAELPAAVAALKTRNATWFGVIPTSDSNAQRQYGPDPGSLAAESGGAVFDISDFRTDAKPVLKALLSKCAQAVIQQKQLQVKPSPRVRPGGRRTCTDFKVTAGGKAVKKATVRISGVRASSRTNSKGRTRICTRFNSPGSRGVRATKSGFLTGKATLFVSKPPRFTG